LNITALLYIDDGLKDDDLFFSGIYLPDDLKKRLSADTRISSVKYSVPESYSGSLKNELIRRKDNDDLSFWKEMFSELKADHIVKIFCDSPFMDMEIIRDMIDAHTKYLAEFTYSENLPSGFSCEIMSKELIDAIPEPEEKTLPLGQVIRSNINKFDVELYFKEPDIRDKRLSFRSGSPREKQVMERVYNITGNVPGYAQIKKIIDDNPLVLYVSPSYIEIEITGNCDLNCIFCYRNTLKQVHPEMEMDLLKKVLNNMESIGLPYSICFGGSGEPLMHSRFYEILDLVRSESLIENIIIETNGILADTNFRYYIIKNNDKRIKIIFNINGMDEDTYISIHHKDFFKQVLDNIVSLRNEYPADNSIYVQIMKINETEQFLDRYYDFWETHKIPIILQKQNTYMGRIKDRTYSDLTPLERTPCWHLQRDFYVLSGGKTAFCKEDVDGDYARGNLNKETVEEIFSKSKEFFLNDYKKKYPANPDCASCNEWYTFNF
jgi:spiro-SPASM protein